MTIKRVFLGTRLTPNEIGFKFKETNLESV